MQNGEGGREIERGGERERKGGEREKERERDRQTETERGGKRALEQRDRESERDRQTEKERCERGRYVFHMMAILPEWKRAAALAISFDRFQFGGLRN